MSTQGRWLKRSVDAGDADPLQKGWIMGGLRLSMCVTVLRWTGALCLIAWGGSVLPAANADSAGSVIGARVSKDSISFPACAAVVDVTKPPYNARGDGQTDDTDAIQKALTDTMGAHKVLYFPNGTYLVSKTLRYTKKDSRGGEAWGFNWIQGQDEDHTIIRLKDGVFPNARQPQPILWGGGFGSADWFHNYVQNVTFDVGRDNTGAIGLNFYSNNSGAIRDVQILSQDGSGAIGLDLGNNMNGPLLVCHVIVRGFAVGIRAASSVNSQTFEHISLIGQSVLGFANDGQSIGIRGLYSDNTVTALRANSFTCLLDAHLVGRGAANGVPAIQVGGPSFFARNVITTGYRAAIAGEDGKGDPGPNVAEYMIGTPNSPFGGRARSLNLPIEETPDLPWDDAKTWVVVEVPADSDDASPAIQKAVDSGATTVFIASHQKIVLKSPVTIRGGVRRVLGCGNEPDYLSRSKPDFIIADGDSPVVVFEHFANINGGVLVDTDRTIVFRSAGTRLTFKRKGDVFLEDYCGSVQPLPGQRIWARQLNIENQGTHLMNDAGTLWILGYKTERGGTLIYTKGGGRTECLGNFSYTTTAGGLAPMFVTEDSSVFVYFNEVCYNGDPFRTLVSETRNGVNKTVGRRQGGIAPYVGLARER